MYILQFYILKPTLLVDSGFSSCNTMSKLISFLLVRNSKRDTRPFRNFYLPFTLGPFDPIANLNMIIRGIRYKNSRFILSTIHSWKSVESTTLLLTALLLIVRRDSLVSYINVRTLVSYLFVFKFSFCCSLYSLSASVCCSLFVSKLSDSQSVFLTN